MTTLPDSTGSEERPPEPAAEARERAEFVMALGRALHEHGTPAHRLESALEEVAASLGLEGRFFSTPTALFSSFGRDEHREDPTEERERVHLDRLPASEISLRNLVQIDRLAQLVIQGTVGVREATSRIRELEAGPRPYGPWLRVLAFSLASAAGSRLLGGGSHEILASLAFGGATGLLAWWGRGRSSTAKLWPPLASFLVAVAASALGAVVALNGPIVLIAAIIVLLPGLSLTVGVSELVQGSLVSGASRLAGAILSLVLLAFGMALGTRAGMALGFAAPTALPESLPDWSLILAAALASAAFLVLLEADSRELPWMVLGGFATWGTARLASPLGIELAAFFGAVVAGAGSNLYGRWLRRPAMITRVGSILLLVPGSIGFRGVSSLIAHETLRAVDTAFEVALILVAIAIGLLVANAAVSPRQRL